MLRILKADKKISLFVIIVLFGIIVALRFIYPPVNVLSWDVFGYYLYLPAKFIHHDLGLAYQDWLNKLITQYQTTGTLYQAYIGPTGQWVMKYSVGMAVMYLPFFFISHWIAGLMGFPMDGLSLPYQYGLAIGGLVYSLIGLIYFRKILLKYFSDNISASVLIVTILGTNYINQASVGNLLSHNFLFTLFAVFVWYTIKWHEEKKVIQIALISLVGGLITLIRPTEGVCFVIPLLWGVSDKATIKEKLGFVIKYKYQVFLGLLCFIVVLLPQFYYWKKYAGTYIFYSYPNPGEGLDLLSPHIGNFLFSFRKGWFIYTPMLIFYILGLFQLYKRNRNIFYSVLVYTIVSVYLISSWTCWWYAGGCYSQRAIISLYIVFSLGLGYLLVRWSERKLGVRMFLYLVVFLFIALNLFQFWQFNKDILKHDGMTKQYYFSIFGKTKVPDNATELLLVDRSVTGIERFSNSDKYLKKTIGEFDFNVRDLNNSDRYVIDKQDTTHYCLIMDSSYVFSPGLTIKYKNITGEYYAWIRASIDVLYPKTYNDSWPALVMTFEHNSGSYKYFAGDLVCNKDDKGLWKHITFDYQTPEVRDINDLFKVYIWHRGKKPVFLKNLVIEAFDPIIN